MSQKTAFEMIAALRTGCELALIALGDEPHDFCGEQPGQCSEECLACTLERLIRESTEHALLQQNSA